MLSRRELFVFLCLALMDCMAGFVLLEGVSLIRAMPLGSRIVWLLIYAAWCGVVVSLIAERRGMQERGIRRIVLLAGVLLCALPAYLLLGRSWAALYTTLALALFYWRGMRVTAVEPHYLDIQWRFGAGLAVILLGIILLVARGETEDTGLWIELSLAGIAFTVTALAALGAARMEETGEGNTGRPVFLAIAAQIGVIVLLSLVALSLFSFDLAGLIGDLLSPLWDVVTRVVATVLAILVSPFLLLAERAHLRSPTAHTPRTPLHPPRRPPTSQHSGHQVFGHQWVVAAEIALVALAVALVLLLIWRATSRRERRTRRPSSSEQRQWLISPAQMVRAFLAWLRHRVAERTQRSGEIVARARRRILGPTYPADPVRRVYAQVLYRAGRQGLERPPTVTPVEFQRDLQDRWPSGAFDFAAITSAYIQRRYGDDALSPAQIEQVRQHWHRLRQVMRVEP